LNAKVRRSLLLYTYISCIFLFALNSLYIFTSFSCWVVPLFVPAGSNKVCRAFRCTFPFALVTVRRIMKKIKYSSRSFLRSTEGRKSKELPPLPADFREFQDNQDYTDEDEFYQGDVSSPTFRTHEIAGDHELDGDGRPRVPLIVLAQQSQHPPPLPEPSDPGTFPVKYRLSTISEKSERTEASRHWPSKQQLYAYNDPQPSSPMSSNTSYGQVIGEITRRLVGCGFPTD